jgi:CRISPR/Cas system endoribonuclease Cas6 (RAMP superfamily)
MGQSQRVQQAHEKFCAQNETGLREINTYKARRDSNSMVSTLSPIVRSVLDIDEGDQLTQHVDMDNGVIIIEVDND